MLSETLSPRYPMPYGPNAINIRGKAVMLVGEINSLGRVIAALLAANGAPVFVAARHTNELRSALAEIAQAGGEGDGIVADLRQPDEVCRFFDQAEYWLGKLDVLVSLMALDGNVHAEALQNQVMQEAIQRLRQTHGQIINIGQTLLHSRPHHTRGFETVHNLAAALRRQATSLGIRTTLIEPGEILKNELTSEEMEHQLEDLAGCLLDSLSQSYSPEVIFPQKHLQELSA